MGRGAYTRSRPGTRKDTVRGRWRRIWGWGPLEKYGVRHHRGIGLQLGVVQLSALAVHDLTHDAGAVPKEEIKWLKVLSSG
jgi:hypothetical protein